MAEVAAKKRNPVVMPERCGLAEQKRNEWIVDAEIGVTHADVLEPSYWVHLAPSLNPLDKIEVRSEDGSWIMNLRVLYAERNYARVMQEGEIFQIGESVEKSDPLAKHKVVWKGPVLGFVVLRMSDQEAVKTRCKTREEATAWMVEHEKTTRI